MLSILGVPGAQSLGQPGMEGQCIGPSRGVVPCISRAQQEQLCKDANIDGPILMCLDAYSSATTHDVSAAPAPRPPEAMNMSDEEFDGAP